MYVIHYLRLQGLVSVIVRILCDVKCAYTSVAISWRRGRTYCLHLQDSCNLKVAVVNFIKILTDCLTSHPVGSSLFIHVSLESSENPMCIEWQLNVMRPDLNWWSVMYASFNPLAPKLFFFLILAHPVYKMWIIQEPNKLALWNKLHFEEKKTESIEHV